MPQPLPFPKPLPGPVLDPLDRRGNPPRLDPGPIPPRQPPAPVPPPYQPPTPPMPRGWNTPESWWKPWSYSGAYDPNAEYAMMVNTLLPYMSPESEKAFALHLSEQDKAFRNYAPTAGRDYGQEGDLAQRGAYTSPQQARAMWNAINQGVLSGGKKDIYDMGPALPWLHNILATLEQYGTGPADGSTGWDRRTRAQERALQNDLNRYFSEAQSSKDLQPYLELARNLVAPTFMNAPIGASVPVGFRESAYQGTPYLARNNYVVNPRFT